MEGAKLILIIEDDEILRENTKELLEFSQFRVITAVNGRNGIEKALQYFPDLILCDIMMPVLDGYGVLENLSKNGRTMNIPFLFTSAKTDPSEIRKGMNLGADDYIVKPYKESDLINAINKRIYKFNLLKESSGNKSVSPTQRISVTSLKDFKNLLRSKGEQFSFKKRTTIFQEKEKANFVFLIEQGLVKTIKMDDDGKELITCLYRQDNLFGLNSFNSFSQYDETAVAMEDGIGFRFSSKSFREIVNNNHELVLEIAEILSENLTDLKEHLLEMAYGSVLKKTTQIILNFAKDGSQNVINITRNEMAHVAGISPESFIRSLSLLRKKKMIEIEGKNIRILNFEELKRIR